MRNSLTKSQVVVVLAAVFCLTVSRSAVLATDTLSAKGNKNHDGTFQTFKNDRFYFLPATGKKALSEQRLNVEKLAIDPPARATVTPRGKKKIENMKLKGYEKNNFIFDVDGKEISMPASQISLIDIGLDLARGNDDGEIDQPGPAIMTLDLKELTAWMKEGNPTEVQTKAYERYSKARTTYDNFLKESSEMVKVMDKSTGPAREDLLNKLRKRKNDEQVILGEVKNAEPELLAAFPELKPATPKKEPAAGRKASKL